MSRQERKTIAIDIDDVIAKTTEAVRLWANHKAGVNLQTHDYYLTEQNYWSYYEGVWQKHGLSDLLKFEEFLDSMDVSQAHIAVIDGARQGIAQLKRHHDIVFMTARRPQHKDSTRRWLDEHIDAEIPLYLSLNPFANQAARSKGELCAELGVDVLIDDSVDNCQSAVQYGVEAILFGDYGWNSDIPAGATRCVSWREVEEQLSGR